MGQMKKMHLIFFMGIMMAILLGSNALAYLDPNTGGVILNTIWPFIVAFFSAVGAFIIKYFWKPIKKAFSKLIAKN